MCQAAETTGPPVCFGGSYSKAVSGQEGLEKSELFAACSIGYWPVEVRRPEWMEPWLDFVHFHIRMN